MVFLLGFDSCLLHVQVRERKKGGALSWRACGAMCTWTAGLLDAVIGSTGGFMYLSVCVVACATSTFVGLWF